MCVEIMICNKQHSGRENWEFGILCVKSVCQIVLQVIFFINCVAEICVFNFVCSSFFGAIQI